MRKTILVVDDTKENLEILIELLSDKYDVMVALNAQTGIEIVKEDKPDLILLDIMMPGMDGYEMCEILKKDEKVNSIPIIFITAKTDEKSIEKAYDTGGVDYISKPFKPKELLARIATQLKVISLVNNLENIVEYETKKRVEQENILMHQSRLAAVGEMMDVIAHQWMQPISVVNSQISLLGLDVQMKTIDEVYVQNLQKKFSKQIQHMTSTLREFRNFFRPSYDRVNFDATQMIHKALVLVDDEFTNKNITIEFVESKNFTLCGIENEFIHLILNLLNNAKDAFNNVESSMKKIVINLIEDDEYNSIEILDNAGGIPEEIIDDIFKMNITGHNGSGGTGIGLYISLLIAQKHNGILNAINVKNGAKFTLKQRKVVV